MRLRTNPVTVLSAAVVAAAVVIAVGAGWLAPYLSLIHI